MLIADHSVSVHVLQVALPDTFKGRCLHSTAIVHSSSNPKKLVTYGGIDEPPMNPRDYSTYFSVAETTVVDTGKCMSFRAFFQTKGAVWPELLLKVVYTLKLPVYLYSWFRDYHIGDSYLNYSVLVYNYIPECRMTSLPARWINFLHVAKNELRIIEDSGGRGGICSWTCQQDCQWQLQGL